MKFGNEELETAVLTLNLNDHPELQALYNRSVLDAKPLFKIVIEVAMPVTSNITTMWDAPTKIEFEVAFKKAEVTLL